MLSIVAGVAGESGPPTPGPATSSHLDYPYGVAVDAKGDLFIADWGNHVVEEVTPPGHYLWWRVMGGRTAEARSCH